MYRMRPRRAIGRIINTRPGIGGLGAPQAFDLAYSYPVIGSDAEVASTSVAQAVAYIDGSQPEQIAHGMLSYEDQSTQVLSPPTQYLGADGEVYTWPGGATETTGAYDAPTNGVPTLSRDVVGDQQALIEASYQVEEAREGSLDPAVAEPVAGGPLLADVADVTTVYTPRTAFARPADRGWPWGWLLVGGVVVGGGLWLLAGRRRRRR